MAWIESHQTLKEHPKTKRLARILSIPQPAVIGHLHCFWWWALDYAQEGDLSKYDEHDIADAAMWDGDAEQFLSAMVDAGYLDDEEGVYYIHDWMDYAGRLIERRQRDADRKRKERDVRGTSNGHSKESVVTVPNRTQPNRTVPNQEEENISSEADSDSAVPYDEIVSLFHKTTPSLPQIRKLSDKRRRAVRARWRASPDFEVFSSVFQKAEESNFLSGRSGQWAGCSFDWLMNESNMLKVLEGNYDNRSKGLGNKESLRPRNVENALRLVEKYEAEEKT